MKAVRVRPLADREISTFAEYIALDSLNAALRFMDSMQETFDLMSHQPGIGSLRYARLPMLKNLRVLPVTSFKNHLVFYIERPDYIDVLRVLHGARDIPAILIEETEPVG